MTTIKNSRDAATALRAHGVWCVPIPANQKGPQITDWPGLRLQPYEIPTTGNVGVILGKPSGWLVDVDLDCDEAVELAAEYLPATVITGRDGRPNSHWWYVCPGAETKKFADGRETIVEIRSTGGQTVVGPSTHPEGGQYDCLNLDTGPADVSAKSLLAAVQNLYCAVLRKRGHGEQAEQLSPPVWTPPQIGDSPGNEYSKNATSSELCDLFRAAGWTQIAHTADGMKLTRPGKADGTSATLRHDGVMWVFYCFSSSAEPFAADKGYTPFQVYALLKHGGDFSAAAFALSLKQVSAGVAVDISGILNDDDQPRRKPDDPTFPSECLDAPGFLNELIEFNLRTAIYPQPELALSAAFSLLSCLTGGRIQDSWGSRPNVFILGLAPSGAGKEHGRKVNKKILALAGALNRMGNERIASHSGLINKMDAEWNVLWQLDEIGRFFQTTGDARRSPHLFNIVSVLLQLYSSADTVWTSDAYADGSKSKTLMFPHVVLYGTAVPDGFWQGLTSENVSDGFLGRFLVFEGPYVRMQDPEPAPVPANLVDVARAWVELKTHSGNLAGATNHEAAHPLVMEYTTEATARIRDHTSEIADRRMTEEPTTAAVWSRTAEKTRKLALLYAASRATAETLAAARVPIVELEDVNRAITASNWVTRRVLQQAGLHVAENDWDAKVKRVRRILTKRMTQNELTRKTQFLRHRERQEIIHQLIESGQIQLVETGTGKNAATTFDAVKTST